MFFPSLVAYMSSGPVLALVIARDQAISYWRELIGPTNALKARQTHPDWYGHKSESRYSLYVTMLIIVILNLENIFVELICQYSYE